MHLSITALLLALVIITGHGAPQVVQDEPERKAAEEAHDSGPFTLPVIDLDARPEFHFVVDREAGQYLGHPTTVLLEDGETILCVYPKGHGKGGIVYKRSNDGGKTWSDRLPTPDNWSTSREVPTLHRVVDAGGKRRLIMWSGLYPARLAVSEDDGATWGPLAPAGEWGGIAVMGCVVELAEPGHYLAMFHDDGRFLSANSGREDPVRFKLLKTFSKDGGLTWSTPEVVWSGTDMHLCEPGAIKSADGERIAVLLRENSRRRNSHLIVSDDGGASFSAPRPLPASLTGDRHTGVRAPDGRLFISFRDVAPAGWDSPTDGDWVAWVGTFDDLVSGAEGQYRVRLKDNLHAWDCAYPGVVLQPDGTIVTTTYGHWDAGEQPYIRTVRLKLADLDQLATEAQND
jgi:BNR repeat protein